MIKNRTTKADLARAGKVLKEIGHPKVTIGQVRVRVPIGWWRMLQIAVAAGFRGMTDEIRAEAREEMRRALILGLPRGRRVK